jgi:predicted Rossmann fold nucleotide-binding protein DprA/Smf involved in DNA uptake
MAAGSNALLRDGACVITSPQDVLDELFGPGARVVEVATEEPSAAPDDPVLRTLLEAIEAGQDPQAAAQSAGLPAGDARAALARLEAEGYVVRVGLAGFERAAARRRR